MYGWARTVGVPKGQHRGEGAVLLGYGLRRATREFAALTDAEGARIELRYSEQFAGELGDD